jgi:hypothetical protein
MRHRKNLNIAALESSGRRASPFLGALRSIIFLMLSMSAFLAAPGCGMFQQRPKRPEKVGAQTVEEWIGQKRVNP